MTRATFRHRLLLALFVGAIVFTGYHAVRAVSAAIYWHNHRDETIQRWMTIGYVAHSYHVPPHVLHRALDLPPAPDHRPLGRLAQDTGQSFTRVKEKLDYAIVHARPPYPPPAPPAPPPPHQ